MTNFFVGGAYADPSLRTWMGALCGTSTTPRPITDTFYFINFHFMDMHGFMNCFTDPVNNFDSVVLLVVDVLVMPPGQHSMLFCRAVCSSSDLAAGSED